MNPGDEVIISNPYYACYPNYIRMFDDVPKDMKVLEKHSFKYDIETLKDHITERTKAILINSPANPTGAVYTAEEMRAIASLGNLIIADEIYHGLIYGCQCRTMLEFTENCIVFNGFSKRYAMTGFRMGYTIVSKDSIRAMQILQQNFFLCAVSFPQEGALAVLTEDCSDEMDYIKGTYNQRRIYLLRR